MATAPATGSEELERFLAARGLRHAVVEHDETFSAGAEARVAAVPAQHAAKAVMTRDQHGYLLAVIPASRMLDLHKLRRVASRPQLRLATERELATDFPAFEVGALPPFGELFGCPELIDGRLASASRILCNGGDHRHSIVVNAHELTLAAGAGIGDLSIEHGEDEPERTAAPAGRPAAR